jgi:hypothetical protein
VHFVADQRHERLLDLTAVGGPNDIDLNADGSRCCFQVASDSLDIFVVGIDQQPEAAWA